MILLKLILSISILSHSPFVYALKFPHQFYDDLPHETRALLQEKIGNEEKDDGFIILRRHFENLQTCADRYSAETQRIQLVQLQKEYHKSLIAVDHDYQYLEFFVFSWSKSFSKEQDQARNQLNLISRIFTKAAENPATPLLNDIGDAHRDFKSHYSKAFSNIFSINNQKCIWDLKISPFRRRER